MRNLTIGTLVLVVLLLSSIGAARCDDTGMPPAGGSANSTPDKQMTPAPAPISGGQPASQEPPPAQQQPATAPQQQPATAVQAQPATRAAENKPPAGYDDAVKLYKSGKVALAAQKFEQFVKAGTADDNCHLVLAACYRSLKQYGKAIAEYDWLAKNSKSLTQKRVAESEAYTLRCYQKGICPGQCLKLSTPGWQHYPGLDPNLLWMKFPYPGGWSAWSTHHLGEVIQYENGKPVNKGVCPICHGTGRVQPLK